MNELQKLYDLLQREGYYTKSYEEFEQKYNGDNEYRDKVFDVVSRDGFYTKTKDEFLQKYSIPQTEIVETEVVETEVVDPELKKKDITDSNLEDGSLDSSEIQTANEGDIVEEGVITGEELLKEEEEVKTLEAQPIEDDYGFGSYLVDALDAGVSTVSKSIYDLPALIYDGAALITNPIARALGVEEASSEKMGEILGIKNVPSEIVGNRIKEKREQIQKYNEENGGDALGALEEGNILGAAKMIAGTTVESLPLMIPALMTGGSSTGLTIVGASTASTKAADLKEENPEMDVTSRTINAAATGFLEAALGQLMTGASGAVTKKILAQEGKEKAAKIISQSFKDILEESIESSPILPLFGEMLEESLVSVGEQLTDMSTGVRSDFSIREAINSGISATGMGGVNTVSVYGARGYVSAKEYAKLKKINKNLTKLSNEVLNSDLSENEKQLLNKSIERLKAQGKKVVDDAKNKVSLLPDNVRKELDETALKLDATYVDAFRINSNTKLDKTSKALMLEQLKIQAIELTKKKNDILSTEYKLNEFEVLPDTDKIKLKEEAAKMLFEEAQSEGKTEINITDSQISKRAFEIYNSRQDSPLTNQEIARKKKLEEALNNDEITGNTITVDDISISREDAVSELQQINKKQTDAIQKPITETLDVQEEVVPTEEVSSKTQETDVFLDQEVSDLESAIDEESSKVDFKLKSNEDIEAEFGPSADEVQDVTRQINELNTGNVATVVESKQKQAIDIDELNSRTERPLNQVTMEVVKNLPTIFTISDQLTTGNTINPYTGNEIVNLKGGLGFTATEGNENAAWANTTKKEAEDLYIKADRLYQENKETFDNWWKQNPEYNGLVPMNVVKMGEGSMLSNEATFRVLEDNLSIIPSENKEKALNALRDVIAKDTETKEAKVKEGSVSDNTLKQYKKSIDANNKTLELLEGLNSIEEAISTEKIKQLTLPSRRMLLEKIAYGKANRANEKVTPGKPSTPVALALLEGMSDDSRMLLNIGSITDVITDNQMAKIPQRSIVAIQGVDVLGNPEQAVVETTHPNYPFGVRGKTIGVLKESQAIQDIYPTAFNNAMVGLTKAETKGKSYTEKQVKENQEIFDKAKQKEKEGKKLSVKEKEALKIGRLEKKQLKPSSLGTILTETIGVQNGLPGLEFIGAVTEGNVSNMNKLTSFMNTAFPSVVISTDPTTFDNVLASEGVRVFLKGDEVVYGVTVDGDVYINPEVHNSESSMFNTAIHEMGHVWTDYLQTSKKGKQIYDKGVELVSETDEYNKQLKIFNGDAKAAANETMAILIGNKGETITDAAMKSKFKEWLLGMWKYIKEQFKMSGQLTEQEIQDMTLDKFLGTALADIFSGKEIKMSDAQLKKLKNPDVAFSKTQSIDSIVELGRRNGFSDAALETVLKNRGFESDAIKSALEVNIDLLTPMPREFGNVEGGANVGFDLFNRVRDKINAFSTEGPRGGRGTTRTKSFAEIRQKAQDILQADQVYQNQPEQNQLELRSALDRSIGIRSNVNVTREISAVRNNLRQRAKGVANLKDAQRRMRMLIRKALPKSKNYSNAIINKLIKTVNETNTKNFEGKIEEVATQIQKQRQVIKGLLVDKIQKIVEKKAKTALTQSKRKRSAGLDAIGQAYFAEVKKVLRLAKKNDVEGLVELQNSIDESQLSEAIKKAENGDKLTRKERQLLDRQLALDSFADVSNMTLEEVEQLLVDVKETRAESIARLNNRREVRRQAVNNVKSKFKEQIESDYSELYDEDGKLKTNEKLGTERESIRQSFEDKGIVQGVITLFNKAKRNNKYSANSIQDFFRNNLSHLGTITNILDRGKEGLFSRVFYRNLNLMEENNLQGVFRQEDVLDNITKSSSKKDWRKWKYSLGKDVITIKGVKTANKDRSSIPFDKPLNRDQAMRIYALSLNEVQRKKLEAQGFDAANMKRIKDFIGEENVSIVEQTVDYLSNKYYNEVNDVYVQANDVNLGYVENYFPTRTISESDVTQDIINGDFSKIFTADTAPALQERTDRVSDVAIGFSFTDVLEEHIKSMEKYKAYALGVKQMNEVYKSQDIQELLKQTGLGPIFKQMLNYAINPESGPAVKDGVVSWIQRKFTGFALAFKPIQTGKQATSFVQAYEDYSFVGDKKIPVLDIAMFAYDYAKVIATLPKQIKEANEVSATFRNRLRKGLQGDVFGLESGSRTFKRGKAQQGKRGALRRGTEKAAGFFTVAGDILGVLGYKAVYNRAIANGMSKAEALEIFNKYNETQQTRLSTQKIGLQMNPSFTARFFTMFGSTVYLQINKVAQSANNIVKDFDVTKGKVGKLKDYRALALNISVANALFTLASYSGALLAGDDEDKEKAWRAIQDAALGLNLIYQIPLAGAAIEESINTLRGDRKPTGEGVNPFVSVKRKILKGYKEAKDGDVIKALKPVVEIILGAQLNAPVGLFNIFSGQGEEEDFYDAIGITPSYRPGYGKRKSSSQSSKTIEQMDDSYDKEKRKEERAKKKEERSMRQGFGDGFGDGF